LIPLGKRDFKDLGGGTGIVSAMEQFSFFSLFLLSFISWCVDFLFSSWSFKNFTFIVLCLSKNNNNLKKRNHLPSNYNFFFFILKKN